MSNFIQLKPLLTEGDDREDMFFLIDLESVFKIKIGETGKTTISYKTQKGVDIFFLGEKDLTNLEKKLKV